MEPLIGRAWFGALYVVGALTGSMFSLALNPSSIVGVGASGAIMGLFAGMLVVSLHFPGSVRTSLLSNAAYVLIPSLLPLANGIHGDKVDYAAHFGGAIGGLAVGLLLLAIWPRGERTPRLKSVALAIALAGVVALAYPVASVLKGYDAMAFTKQLIPAEQYPKTTAEIRLHLSELIARYPRDPRPRVVTTADLLDAGNFAAAEREARAGLAEENLWRTILPLHVGHVLRGFLAIAINDADRPQEALVTAQPVCAALKDGPIRKLLDDRKLCRM